MKFKKWREEYKPCIDYLFKIFITKFNTISVNNLLYTKFAKFLYIHSLPNEYYQLTNKIIEEDIFDTYADDIYDLHEEFKNCYEDIYQNAYSSYELYKFIINYTDLAEIMNEEYEEKYGNNIFNNNELDLFT